MKLSAITLKSESVTPRTPHKKRKRPVGRATNIPNLRSIHELPPEPNGKYWGDLEMDLIVGAKGKGGDPRGNRQNDQYDLG